MSKRIHSLKNFVASDKNSLLIILFIQFLYTNVCASKLKTKKYSFYISQEHYTHTHTSKDFE